MLIDEEIKLTPTEIRQYEGFKNLSDEEITALIEMLWQYSIIAYKTYNKNITK
jgi:hypothetical protein